MTWRTEWEELQPRIERARKRMLDAVDTGISSGSLEGGGGSKRDLSDRLDDNGRLRPDPVAADLKTLDQVVRWVKRVEKRDVIDPPRTWLETIRRLVGTWDRSAAGRDHVTRIVNTPDDGCVSCARVKDSRGVPIWNPRHTTNKLCQTCIADLRRVRARKGHENATTPPVAIIQWRERHSGKQLREDVLDKIMRGKVV